MQSIRLLYVYLTKTRISFLFIQNVRQRGCVSIFNGTHLYYKYSPNKHWNFSALKRKRIILKLISNKSILFISVFHVLQAIFRLFHPLLHKTLLHTGGAHKFFNCVSSRFLCDLTLCLYRRLRNPIKKKEINAHMLECVFLFHSMYSGSMSVFLCDKEIIYRRDWEQAAKIVF